MATQIELSSSELRKLCHSYLQHGNYTIQSVSNSEETSNFEILSYDFKPASSNVVGFLGRHQLLTVAVRLIDGAGEEHTQSMRFFTKSPPLELASRMEYLETFGVFKKEVNVYCQVLPKLMSIFPDVAPKCYFAHPNLLVFENLSDQNFRMAAGRDGLLNYEHLKCALKTLAAMHASSIVYEVRCGKKMNEMYPEAMVENAYPADLPSDHMRMQNVNNANTVFMEIIKTIPKYQNNLEYILEQFSQKIFILFELVKPTSKHQNVFSHGDMWANNVMYQYDEFGEIPIQSRFVDFQLGRYASPLLDVMTILSIPTSRNLRQHYLTQLLNDYYRFMREFLKREQLRIEDYLSPEQFECGVEEYRIGGLFESCLFSHLTVLPPESAESLTGSADGFTDFFQRKRVEICMKAFNTDQLYRERMTDMLEDIVDRYVLQQA